MRSVKTKNKYQEKMRETYNKILTVFKTPRTMREAAGMLNVTRETLFNQVMSLVRNGHIVRLEKDLTHTNLDYSFKSLVTEVPNNEFCAPTVPDVKPDNGKYKFVGNPFRSTLHEI